MSRSGRAREENTAGLSNVKFVKGNVLEPETFRDHMKDIDGVIHCVGTLIESRNDPKLSYNAMNRDSAINVAKVLNENAEQKGEHKKFVLISSEKAPPFLDAYMTSKIEAEKYLQEKCPNLDTFSIRPGFIVDQQHRWWSIPLSFGVNVSWWLNSRVIQPYLPLGSKIDFLFPAKSVQLSTVAHFAIEGVMGNLGTDGQKII